MMTQQHPQHMLWRSIVYYISITKKRGVNGMASSKTCMPRTTPAWRRGRVSSIWNQDLVMWLDMAWLKSLPPSEMLLKFSTDNIARKGTIPISMNDILHVVVVNGAVETVRDAPLFFWPYGCDEPSRLPRWATVPYSPTLSFTNYKIDREEQTCRCAVDVSPY